MSRQNLTDRFINSRKPAPAGQRQEYTDAIVPGLALRVTDRGHKSFVLISRYPSNPKNPTRRVLGYVGVIGLDEARQKAREWLELVGKGIDPKAEEARQQLRRRDARSTPLPLSPMSSSIGSLAGLKRAAKRKGLSKASSSNGGGRGQSPISCRRRSQPRFERS